jgi:cystathionine beta-lyase/cystathionine gamma-synthase
MGDRTRLIWIESPTNPLRNVVDIEGVVARRWDAVVAAAVAPDLVRLRRGIEDPDDLLADLRDASGPPPVPQECPEFVVAAARSLCPGLIQL